MVAPPGWSEPPQTPDFDEYTLVIRGKKEVSVNGERIVLGPGESILVEAGSRVRYANPFEDETEYVSVCMPAFSPDAVHRE
jgi:mannose-6-phosphate isomerase-like protein (cupin superfamily)